MQRITLRLCPIRGMEMQFSPENRFSKELNEIEPENEATQV